ncbi:MAG: hypothetical protein ACI4QB_05380, partial [Eubacteriales bacterium]
MKHKLKGLVCLWLAVLLLTLPALATKRTGWIYNDTQSSVESDISIGKDLYQMYLSGLVTQVTIDDSLPMNQQELQYPEKTGYKIDRWNVWKVSSGDLDFAKTISPSDLLSSVNCGPFLLEPVWEKYHIISQQPTAQEPTVGTQEYSEEAGWVDCTADTYRWYEVEDKVYTVVPENAKSDEIAISDYTIYTFNYLKRWTSDKDLDITFPVSPGDVVRVTRVNKSFDGTVTEYNAGALEKDGDVYTKTIPENQNSFRLYISNVNKAEFKVEVLRSSSNLIPEQTGATLTALTRGKSYYCEAVFSDGAEILRSNVFLVPFDLSCKVTFESNGGSAVAPQTVAY